MPSRQTIRNAAIVAALKTDSSLTLQMVADQYGISRQRVAQIWKRETKGQSAKRGVPLKDRPKFCRACQADYYGTSAKHREAIGHGPGERHWKRNREWVRLYEDGLSTVQISRIYEVNNPTYVGSVIKRHGGQLRPRGNKGRMQVRQRLIEYERRRL